jgi:hypothetical protein
VVREYLIKLAIAVLLTPLVYAVHGAIVRGLRIEPEPLPARGPEPAAAEAAANE